MLAEVALLTADVQARLAQPGAECIAGWGTVAHTIEGRTEVGFALA